MELLDHTWCEGFGDQTAQAGMIGWIYGQHIPSPLQELANNVCVLAVWVQSPIWQFLYVLDETWIFQDRDGIIIVGHKPGIICPRHASHMDEWSLLAYMCMKSDWVTLCIL